MKKLLAVLLLLSPLFVNPQALKGQTRPRRVGQTATTQPAQTAPARTKSAPATNAPPTSSTRPPVLGGANNTGSGPRPQQTPAPASNEPEEIGADEVLRVNTTLVTIPVSVMDRNGRYIPNLRKEDFRIYEDGVEQQVAYFASMEKPFTVALVIDTSGSTRNRIDEIQDAAIAFVDQLRPEDRVLVVSFNDEISILSEATNDRNALRNAIRRTSPGDGTRLYDTLDMLIHQRLNRIQGRKAIVLFTDGVDTTSKRATYESTVRDAEELDALIYPVQYDTYDDLNGGSSGSSSPLPNINLPFPLPGIGSIIFGGGHRRRGGNTGGGVIGSSRADYARADAYLNDLSTKTGARLYHAETTGNLRQTFALVAEELRRQYSLGYYPKSPGQTGQRRSLRVRVNRPELAVRARDSYIVGSAPGTTAQDQRAAPVLRNNRFKSANRTPLPRTR
ncbi:MAG TPA: VWA domain-containing protein [Pyrinomonadaceae bacterium]|jgi:VWFA-related protein